MDNLVTAIVQELSPDAVAELTEMVGATTKSSDIPSELYNKLNDWCEERDIPRPLMTADVQDPTFALFSGEVCAIEFESAGIDYRE